MRTAVLSWEAAPFAEAGILAEDVSSLCSTLAKNPQNKVTLCLPRHKCIDRRSLKAEYKGAVSVRCDDTEYTCGIFSLNHSAVRVLFVEYDLLFDRDGGIYSQSGDENIRTVVFTRAVLEFISGEKTPPETVIANEWQTSLAPVYIRTIYSNYFKGTKTLLHIRSFEYAGIFHKQSVTATGLGWEAYCEEHMKYHDNISFLKSGIIYADAVVSDTFVPAENSMLPGFDGLTEKYSKKCTVILPFLEIQKALNTAKKQSSRESLILKTGLDRSDAPLFAFYGKGPNSGLSLLMNITGTVLSENNALFCIMHDGKGGTALTQNAELLARSFPGRVSLYIGENEEFESELFSAADYLIICPEHPDTRSILRAFSSRAVPIVSESSIAEKLCRPAEGHERGVVFTPAVEYQLYRAICTSISLFNKDGFHDLQEHEASFRRTVSDYTGDYLELIQSL